MRLVVARRAAASFSPAVRGVVWLGQDGKEERRLHGGQGILDFSLGFPIDAPLFGSDVFHLTMGNMAWVGEREERRFLFVSGVVLAEISTQDMRITTVCLMKNDSQ